MELDLPDRWDLIVESRKESEKFGRIIQAAVQKYTSSAYEGQAVSTADDPENYHFAHVVNNCSRNLIDDPRAHLAWGEEIESGKVQAYQDGLNAWFIDTNYRALREQFCVDMSLGYAVATVCQEPRVGHEEYGPDALQTPRLYRVPPSNFGWDVAANSFDLCEHMDHVCVRKKARMLRENSEEDGWNLEAIRAMDEQGVEQSRGRQVLRRGECAYFEMWDRHHRLPDDDPAWADIPKERRRFYHGTIFTIAWGAKSSQDTLGKALEIRRAYPFFGPRSGPYVLGGFLTVPNCVAPLSAPIANRAQIDALNRQARANDSAAESYKENTLVDAPTQDGKWAVMNAKHGDVLATPGLDPSRVAAIKQGGVSPESQVREEFLRLRTDRAMFTSDEQRGQANPDTKATNALIAANAASGPSNLFDAKFAEFEANCARNVLWFMDQDDRTAIRGGGGAFLGAKDEEGVERAGAQGFPVGDLEEAPEDDLTLEDMYVRVESMRMDGSETANFVQVANFATQLLPLAAELSAFADLTPLFERAAEVYEFPELRRIFDQKAAQKAMQDMAKAEAKPAPRTIPAKDKPAITQGASGKPHVEPRKVKVGGKK